MRYFCGHCHGQVTSVVPLSNLNLILPAQLVKFRIFHWHCVLTQAARLLQAQSMPLPEVAGPAGLPSESPSRNRLPQPRSPASESVRGPSQPARRRALASESALGWHWSRDNPINVRPRNADDPSPMLTIATKKPSTGPDEKSSRHGLGSQL